MDTHTTYDVLIKGSMAIVLVKHEIQTIASPASIHFDFAVPAEAVILQEDTLYTPPEGGVSHPRTSRSQPYPGIIAVDVDNHEIGGTLASRLQYALPAEFHPAPTLLLPTAAANVLTPWRDIEGIGGTASVSLRDPTGRATLVSGSPGDHPLGVPIRIELPEYRPASLQGVAKNGAAVDVSIDPRLDDAKINLAVITDLELTSLLSDHLAASLSQGDAIVQVGQRGMVKAERRQPLRPSTDVAADIAAAAADPDVSDILVVLQGGNVAPTSTSLTGCRVHALAIGPNALGEPMSKLVRSTGGTCHLVRAAEDDDLASAVAALVDACRRPRSTVATRNGGRGATKAMIFSPTATIDILVSPEPSASHRDDIGGFVEGMLNRARA